jgi:hypothetical protein
VGRLIRRLGVLGVLAGLALGLAPVASAATWATFGTPTAESTYGAGVQFSQPVTIEKPVARVELLLTVAGAIGPTVIGVPAPTATGTTVLSHLLDTSGGGHLFPNTPLAARWRLVAAGDSTDTEMGPVVRLTYADDRFDWKTESGPLVRVHWSEGTADFGRRALKIGEDGVRKASELLGVTESKPVDFFVYADQAAFYDALGPGTRENVGGEAPPIPGLRTLYAIIPPSQIDDAWVGIVIPHELTHLVFDSAADNPYHFPPRWLNEGLAVYETQGYDASDRGLVDDAIGARTLIPLDGLVGEFPTSADGFFLAYAESVAAVDFMIRTYGSDALVAVIRSYKGGRTDDEAFKQGLGVDMTAFEAAWMADLGAKEPTRYGPQPAPAGPIPSAWQGEPGGAVPVASGAGATAAPSAGPQSPAPTSRGDTTLAVVAVLGVVVVGVVLLVIWQGRRRAREGPGS